MSAFDKDSKNLYPTQHAEHQLDITEGRDGDRDMDDIKRSDERDMTHEQQAEDRATELRLAQIADPGPKLGSRANIMFCLYALVICMCGGDSGGSHLPVFS